MLIYIYIYIYDISSLRVKVRFNPSFDVSSSGLPLYFLCLWVLRSNVSVYFHYFCIHFNTIKDEQFLSEFSAKLHIFSVPSQRDINVH